MQEAYWIIDSKRKKKRLSGECLSAEKLVMNSNDNFIGLIFPENNGFTDYGRRQYTNTFFKRAL